MSGLHVWLAAGVLAGVLGGAPASTPSELQPIAQSAQLALAGRVSAAGLTLRVQPAVSGAPLAVTALSVSFDGVNETATRQADGSWIVPLPPARTGRVDVFILHDGIREVLSGNLPAPGAEGSAAGAPGTNSAQGTSSAPATSGATGNGGPGSADAEKSSGAVHGGRSQLAWWILNIAIVVIAVIAISRRMS